MHEFRPHAALWTEEEAQVITHIHIASLFQAHFLFYVTPSRFMGIKQGAASVEAMEHPQHWRRRGIIVQSHQRRRSCCLFLLLLLLFPHKQSSSHFITTNKEAMSDFFSIQLPAVLDGPNQVQPPSFQPGDSLLAYTQKLEQSLLQREHVMLEEAQERYKHAETAVKNKVALFQAEVQATVQNLLDQFRTQVRLKSVSYCEFRLYPKQDPRNMDAWATAADPLMFAAGLFLRLLKDKYGKERKDFVVELGAERSSENMPGAVKIMAAWGAALQQEEEIQREQQQEGEVVPGQWKKIKPSPPRLVVVRL